MFTTVSSLLTRLGDMDDRRAWEVFHERYARLLRSYFRKCGVADQITVDLAQDVIHRAVRGLGSGGFQRSRGRVRDWIGGIARNVLRNHLRRSASAATVVGPKTQFWEMRADPVAEGRLAEAEGRFDAIWVRSRLSSLIRLAAQYFDRRDLQCFFLVQIRKRPVKEVASRLGLSETAVFRKRRLVAEWFQAVGPQFVSNWEN